MILEGIGILVVLFFLYAIATIKITFSRVLLFIVCVAVYYIAVDLSKGGV